MTLKVTGQVNYAGQLKITDHGIQPTLPVTYNWDGTLHTEDWNIEPGNGSITSDGSNLVIATDDFSGTPPQPRVAYKWNLTGDFDIRAFFDNSGINTTSNKTYLFLCFSDGTYVYHVGMNATNGVDNRQQTFTNNPAVSGAFNLETTNTDTTNRFRFERVGSTLTAYIKSGLSTDPWVVLASPINIGTGDISNIQIRVQSNSGLNPHPDGVQTGKVEWTIIDGTIA